MRGVFALPFKLTTTGNGILVLLRSPAAGVMEILKVTLGNMDVNTADQMEVRLARVLSANIGTPAGTDISTSIKGVEKSGDTSAVQLAQRATFTTPPSTYSDLDADGVPNLSGYRFAPAPEERIIIGVNDALAVRVADTISSTSLVGTIVWREIVG